MPLIPFANRFCRHGWLLPVCSDNIRANTKFTGWRATRNKTPNSWAHPNSYLR
jgi:hypothetical protein